MKNVWIHGAHSSPVTFNFLRKQVDWQGDAILPHYNVDHGIIDNVVDIKKEITDQTDEPVNIIGHSLGGVMALLLERSGLKVNKIISVSAPFGGVELNGMLRWWFPHDKLYRDMYTLKKRFGHIRNPFRCPHLCLVTTFGKNPVFMGKRNDGVLTVESQTHFPDVDYEFIDLNHFEVLLSTCVAEKIQWFLK